MDGGVKNEKVLKKMAKRKEKKRTHTMKKKETTEISGMHNEERET